MKPIKACIFYGTLFLIFGILNILVANINGNAFIFGGIAKSMVKGDVNFKELGQWLLVLSPVLLVSGYYMDNALRMSTYTLYRFNDLRHWEQKQSICLVGQVTIYCVVCGIISICYFSNYRIEDIIICFVLLEIHLVFLINIWRLIRYISHECLIPTAIIFLTQTVGYILAEEMVVPSKYNAMIWGMYVRSIRIDYENGFSTVWSVLIQIFIIVLMHLATFRLRKNLKIG